MKDSVLNGIQADTSSVSYILLLTLVPQWYDKIYVKEQFFVLFFRGGGEGNIDYKNIYINKG